MLQIKIPVELPNLILKKRELRKSYETNRSIKGISLYLYLKSITIAGHINNPEEQLKEILNDLKVSRATYYNYLKYALELGILSVSHKRISLLSWSKFCDLFNIEKSFISFSYDNQKAKLEHVITALEIKSSQEKQIAEIKRKLNHTPYIKDAFTQFCAFYNLTLEFNRDNLWKAQQLAFSKGLAKGLYADLFLVNPDINRSNSKIAKSHNYKSKRLSTYTKRKLENSGLIRVKKRAPVCCIYRNNGMPASIRGVNVKAFTFYNVESKVKSWHLTDDISLNLQNIQF